MANRTELIDLEGAPDGVEEKKSLHVTLSNLSAHFRLLMLSLACFACEPIKEAPINQSTPALEVSEGIPAHSKATETDVPVNLEKLSDLFTAQLANLSETDQKRLQEIVGLLKQDLKGIKLSFSDFAGEPAGTRSLIGYSADQLNKGDITLELSKDWSLNNLLDVTILAHELLHCSRVMQDRENLSEEDWRKLYGMPGNLTEIRKELPSWELSLNLMNSLSEGLLEESFLKLAELMRNQAPYEDAEKVVNEYAEKILKKLNANPSQLAVIKKWMQINFAYSNYRFIEGADSTWTYNFAVLIAREYPNGMFYIIEQKPEFQGRKPEVFIYPFVPGTDTNAYSIMNIDPSGQAIELKKREF